MAKLTKKAAKGLVDAGYITQEQYDKMLADGEIKVSVRKPKERLVMRTATGVEVVPSFYWGGGGSVKIADYTDEMVELKERVNALIKEYASNADKTEQTPTTGEEKGASEVQQDNSQPESAEDINDLF